ncbi:hypothetical protein HK100_008155 [Physocladia obscura]|uniref:RRM domain-containing protein n=1 Tax=Physocladia obscura TaxID=109957 RepID=A0AAD5SN64_9FUNG|nr:hypothetical protein HK100_008155 [Physocladia obscura]
MASFALFTTAKRLFSAAPRVLDTKRLFVGNLSFSVRQEDLASLFAQHGKVEQANLISDRETGRSRGFAFVEMEENDAIQAIEKLNGFEFQGRELRVNEAESKERPQGDRPPRRDFDRAPRRDGGQGGFGGNRGGNSFGGNRGGDRGGDRRGGNDKY